MQRSDYIDLFKIFVQRTVKRPFISLLIAVWHNASPAVDLFIGQLTSLDVGS